MKYYSLNNILEYYFYRTIISYFHYANIGTISEVKAHSDCRLLCKTRKNIKHEKSIKRKIEELLQIIVSYYFYQLNVAKIVSFCYKI